MKVKKSMENNKIIVMKNVTKKYRSGDTFIHALDDVSLEVKKGEFVLILGKSGSGKSTLLAALSGLINIDDGDIWVNGFHINKMKEDDLARFRRKNVGIIFQFFNLHEALSAIENVELPLFIAGESKKKRRERALEMLQVVGIEHRKTHWPYELSGGEKQRVGIARALAPDPEILIADEPTGDLDSESGAQILELFLKLKKEFGKTMVIVTHDESLIRPGMRVLKMQDGKIISEEIVTSNSDTI